MKHKRKNFFYASLILMTPGMIALSVSCSKTASSEEQLPENNKTDEQIVKDYINKLQPKLKAEKVEEKGKTYTSAIDTKELVEKWFDGLPQSNNGINVEFISSKPQTDNKSILEVKYKISKGNYTQEYIFTEGGFLLTTPEELEEFENKKVVNEFISKLKPTIKKDKEAEKPNTLASTINTEDLVKKWFDGLPESTNEIKVEFVSAKALGGSLNSLEVKYNISKGKYTQAYTFYETGFKKRTQANFQEFSEKNSFKIAFQISDKVESTNQPFKVSGTAWSWYYKKNSDVLYDWYLMTNFHVVNEVVAYSSGNSKVENNKWMYKDPAALLRYHASNTTTTYDVSKNYFDLSTYSDTTKEYNSIIYANKESGNNHEQAISNKDIVKKIDIIADFNNDNLDLFSKSNQGVVEYNLDMALVKISMDFSNKKDYLNSDYKRPNVYGIYNGNAEHYKTNKYDPSKGVDIAGHPASQGKLIVKHIDSSFKPYNVPIISYDQVLVNLKAPYYISETPQPNFLLTGGASGSAVYQLSNSDDTDWISTIPVGIYWGGFATNQDNPFHNFLPSVIPMIAVNDQSATYNIFENFKNILNV